MLLLRLPYYTYTRKEPKTLFELLRPLLLQGPKPSTWSLLGGSRDLVSAQRTQYPLTKEVIEA